MPTRANEYRVFAEQCERDARTMKDPHLKEQMLPLARHWREMAADLEGVVSPTGRWH
jgi:hypothetical protein